MRSSSMAVADLAMACTTTVWLRLALASEKKYEARAVRAAGCRFRWKTSLGHAMMAAILVRLRP